MSTTTNALLEAAAFIDAYDLPVSYVTVYGGQMGVYVAVSDEDGDGARRNAVRRWSAILGGDIRESVDQNGRVHVDTCGGGFHVYAILDETREPVNA